jgi:SagB-type dehydrogenase family enzyme
MISDFKDGDNSEIVFFWTPALFWRIENDELVVGNLTFKGKIKELFPDFYFLTQKGASKASLVKYFEKFGNTIVTRFIEVMIDKKVLVNGLLSPNELFYTQKMLFTHSYSEKIKYDADELEKFKLCQLNRDVPFAAISKTKLVMQAYPENIENRISYRNFDEANKVPFVSFTKMIGIMGRKEVDNKFQYFYASAGGLYPVDIYIYVKDGRVESVGKGLYFYSPKDNSLYCVSEEIEITEDVQYYTNASIFKKSAFTLYFFYNPQVSMPKYDGMGYYYAIIDSGIIVGKLTEIAESSNLGVCSIGDMNFKKIAPFFKLHNSEIYLHCLECGLKP